MRFLQKDMISKPFIAKISACAHFFPFSSYWQLVFFIFLKILNQQFIPRPNSKSRLLDIQVTWTFLFIYSLNYNYHLTPRDLVRMNFFLQTFSPPWISAIIINFPSLGLMIDGRKRRQQRKKTTTTKNDNSAKRRQPFAWTTKTAGWQQQQKWRRQKKTTMAEEMDNSKKTEDDR